MITIASQRVHTNSWTIRELKHLKHLVHAHVCIYVHACMQMCVPIYTDEFFWCPALPLLNYSLETGLSPLTETRTKPTAIKLSRLFLLPPPLNTGAIQHAHRSTQLFKLGAMDLSSGHACTANILTHGDLSSGPEVFRNGHAKTSVHCSEG